MLALEMEARVRQALRDTNIQPSPAAYPNGTIVHGAGYKEGVYWSTLEIETFVNIAQLYVFEKLCSIRAYRALSNLVANLTFNVSALPTVASAGLTNALPVASLQAQGFAVPLSCHYQMQSTIAGSLNRRYAMQVYEGADAINYNNNTYNMAAFIYPTLNGTDIVFSIGSIVPNPNDTVVFNYIQTPAPISFDGVNNNAVTQQSQGPTSNIATINYNSFTDDFYGIICDIAVVLLEVKSGGTKMGADLYEKMTNILLYERIPMMRLTNEGAKRNE